MLLDLSKAVFFFLCILSLFHAATRVFFVTGVGWRERLIITLVYLAFSATVCLFSGLLFAWPVASNPDRGQRLVRTLPVQLFFWGSALVVAAFLTSWYLSDLVQQASPFISDRTLQGF